MPSLTRRRSLSLLDGTGFRSSGRKGGEESGEVSMGLLDRVSGWVLFVGGREGDGCPEVSAG